MKGRDFCLFLFVCSCFMHIYIPKARNNTKYYVQCTFVNGMNELLDFSHFQIFSYSPNLLFPNKTIWLTAFWMTAIPSHLSIKFRLSLFFMTLIHSANNAIYLILPLSVSSPSLEVVEETLVLPLFYS